MPDLAALRANAAHLTVTYAGEPIRIVYRPAALQGDLLDKLSAGEWTSATAQLADVIASWDLTDGDAPLPIDADGLARVGFAVIGTLINAMLRDMANPTWVASNRSPATPTPSGNGSSPAASSAPGASPTITSLSAPPNGPASPHGISPASPTPPAAPAGWHGSGA